MPALQITLNDIFIGGFCGFLLSLPIALFLAFWMSAVKNRGIVVLGGFIGALLGFIIILGWVGTLIFSTPLPNANGASTFFGSVLLCSVLGLAGAIILDLIVARRNARDYRRQAVVHQ
ncbi:MAG: PTS sucrose transporter subunit IIBC [Ktedonobacteraceae bacterium]